jgi:transposase
MATSHSDLPSDVASLRALVAQQRQYIENLEEALRLIRHKMFGRKSEAAPREQLGLFNEAEAILDTEDGGEAEVRVPAHTRKRGGRRPLPEALPRIEILHDLPEAEKVCPTDGHALVEISREVSEQLEVIPATVQVLQHVRPKYACPACKTGVRIAPMPPAMVPKSLASPSLLAYVAVSKYADALPLYRQEAMLERAGIDLSRATLASWMVKFGQGVQPLVNLMREELIAGDFLQMDETRFQVLKEPGKTATSQSYLWVQRGEPLEGRPLVLYDYDPSRSGEVPKRLLEGFRGYLQTDGYEGYGAVCEANGLVHVGCWAHARRRFDEAVKGQGRGALRKKAKLRSAKETKALQGFDRIRKLYRIEKNLVGGSPEERRGRRQELSAPVLAELRGWLDTSLGSVPPKSLAGRALAYLDKQWPKLVRYLDDGRIPMDTNLVENAIRPFVVGRKNWMFADTVHGAEASANLYSLVQTARMNALEPYAYLRLVAAALPKAATLEEIEALLPHRLSAQRLAEISPDALR